MAKHAIFSDIHANWEALVAVYSDFAKVDGLRDVCSLGDLVGYGANPNEVISGLYSLVKKGYTVHYCMGNHDAAALGHYEFVDLHNPLELDRLANEEGLRNLQDIARHYRDAKNRKFVPVRYNAKASMTWTQERLSDAARKFLATESKDFLLLADGVLAVHASPRDPLFDYITNATRAQKAIDSPLMNGIHLCFIGHTHIQGIWQFNAEDIINYAGNVVVMHPPTTIEDTRVSVDPATTITMVNVGSVGQPRDGDPRAVYAIYDDEAHTVELRRVAYDVAAARQKIIDSGLPKVLAERLGKADGEGGVIDEPEAEAAD
jgi:diadenosine tetraphosphatase ApaH/serine/threonine PP2A family protein phosphatase